MHLGAIVEGKAMSAALANTEFVHCTFHARRSNVFVAEFSLSRVNDNTIRGFKQTFLLFIYGNDFAG